MVISSINQFETSSSKSKSNDGRQSNALQQKPARRENDENAAVTSQKDEHQKNATNQFQETDKKRKFGEWPTSN